MTIAFSIESFLIALKDTHFLRNTELKAILFYLRNLNKIDTLVDIINLVSIRSGYSIGGFDADKIVGGLELGVGKEGEIYHGIGRGELNIAGLPVYRDGVAGVGTPTSDEERTKIEMSTTSLLMILNGYSGKEGLLEAGGYSVDLLKRYVSAVNVEAELICRENRGKITL